MGLYGGAAVSYTHLGYELAEKNLYLLEDSAHLIGETGLPEGVTMKKGVPGDCLLYTSCGAEAEAHE